MKTTTISENLRNLIRNGTSQIDPAAVVRGSYAGEYLDSARLNIDDIAEIEAIAYVLASEAGYWDVKSCFNNDQRQRALLWFQSYNGSEILKACLCRLYEADMANEEPLRKPETYMRMIEELKQSLIEISDFNLMVDILNILPEMGSIYSNTLEECIKQLDVYKNATVILKLMKALQNKKCKIKSKLLSNMKKLCTNNITCNSSTFSVLSENFSEREVRYLNCSFISATDQVTDRVIYAFFDCIFYGKGKSRINKHEADLMVQHIRRYFDKKINGHKRLYSIYENAPRIGDKVFKNFHDWQVIYNLLYSENRTINITPDSMLYFPIDKKNIKKWEILKDSEKIKLLASSLHIYDTKEKINEMYSVLVNTWDDIFNTLCQSYAYKSITILTKKNLLIPPLTENDWIKAETKNIEDKFIIKYFIDYCGKTKIIPNWINEKNIVENLSNKNVIEAPKEYRQGYFDILFNLVYYNCPENLIDYIKKLFDSDLISLFMKSDEVKKYAKYLHDSKLINNNDKVCRCFMTDKEYESWIKQKEAEKKEKAEIKKLNNAVCEFKKAIKKFVANNCDLKEFGCWFKYYTQYDETGFLKDSIISLAKKKANENIRLGNTRKYVENMSQISKYSNNEEEIFIDMAHNILKRRGKE